MRKDPWRGERSPGDQESLDFKPSSVIWKVTGNENDYDADSDMVSSSSNSEKPETGVEGI